MTDISAATPSDMCKLWAAVLYAANESGPASPEDITSLLDLLEAIGRPDHVAQVMTRLAGSLVRQLAFNQGTTPDNLVGGIIGAYSQPEEKTEGQ